MQKRRHPEKYKQIRAKQRLEGSRIVNLDQLQKFIGHLTAHAAMCQSDMVLSGEERAGLASILSCKCSKCDYIIPFQTSSKVHGPKGKLQWEVNLAAVWGQMATGGGHSNLCETMSIMGIPVMAPNNFIKLERRLGKINGGGSRWKKKWRQQGGKKKD